MRHIYLTIINLILLASIVNAQSIIYMHQGFEDAYNFPPEEWTILDQDGDGYNWQRSPVGGWNVHSGSGCAASASFDSNTNTPLTPENYLITPAIEVQNNLFELTYYVAAQDNYYSAEHYKVMVSTTGTNPDDFTNTLIDETIAAKAYGNYYERVISLSDFSGQSIYIAFVHYNCTNQFFLDLDDVSVSVTYDKNLKLESINRPVGDCELPDVILPEIDIINNGDEDIYEFTASYVFNGDTVTEVVTDTILPTDTLTYEFIQASDVPENGIYSLKAYIETSGETYINDNESTIQVSLGPNEMPYEINFEAGEDASFWRIIDLNGDNRYWNWSSSGGNTGPGCLRYDYSNTEAAMDLFFSKCMHLSQGKDYRLTFYYKGGSTYFTEKLKVFLSYSQSALDTVMQIAEEDSIRNVTYQLNESVFSVTEDSVYYLNFMACSDANNLFLYVDDIKVEEVFDNDIKITAIKPDYYSLPLKQTRPLSVSAIIENSGQLEAQNVFFQAQGNGWSSNSDTLESMNSMQVNTLSTNEQITPDSQNLYNITLSATMDDTDEHSENNTDSISFEVTDTIMARENGFYTGALGIGSPGTLGHYFELTNPDTLTSVSFFLKSPTEGDTVSVSIYSFDETPQEILRSTDDFVIQSSDPQWYTLKIQGGYLELPEGKFYVGVNEHQENITLGTTPSFFKPETSFIKFNQNGWQTNEALGHPVAYLLRANFGDFSPRPDYNVGVVGILEPNSSCNTPNNAQVSITVKNMGALAVQNIPIVCECNGQIITDTLAENLGVWEEKDFTFSSTLDLSTSGIYQLSCYTNLQEDENINDDESIKEINMGPEEVPYQMGFEADEDYSGWTVEDANNDMFSWDLEYYSPLIANTGENAAIYQYNITGDVAGDDWLFSKCLNLEEENTYKISFEYKTGSDGGINYPEKLKLYLLSAPSSAVADSSNLINDLGTINNNDYNRFEQNINVSETGTYYIGFYVYSDPDCFYIAIDDFSISNVTGIEQTKHSEIKTYPNPADDKLFVSAKEVITEIELFNYAGTAVFKQNTNKNKISIDISHLASGMYIISIKTNNITKKYKIIKE